MNAVEHMELQEAQSQARLRPKAAALAGLLTGIFLIVFSKGVVWSSSGLPDRVMGRELFAGQAEQVFFFNSIVHLAISICFAFILCAIIYRFRPLKAILMGGIVGLGFYGINFLVFHSFLHADPGSEGPVAISHFVYGLMTAGAYKALAVPEKQPSQPLSS